MLQLDARVANPLIFALPTLPLSLSQFHSLPWLFTVGFDAIFDVVVVVIGVVVVGRLVRQ